jgi:threonine dehydrogenase-like Zn-dependent dehydrogenase
MADKFPIGALTEKGLSIKSGQRHAQKYMPQLLKMILDGKLDTTLLISHRLITRGRPARLQAVQGTAERGDQGRAQPQGVTKH